MLKRGDWVCLMVERMVDTMMSVLWRYIHHICDACQFSRRNDTIWWRLHVGQYFSDWPLGYLNVDIWTFEYIIYYASLLSWLIFSLVNLLKSLQQIIGKLLVSCHFFLAVGWNYYWWWFYGLDFVLVWTAKISWVSSQLISYLLPLFPALYLFPGFFFQISWP